MHVEPGSISLSGGNGLYKAHLTGHPLLVHHAKKTPFGGNLDEAQLLFVWVHLGSVHPAPLPTPNFLPTYTLTSYLLPPIVMSMGGQRHIKTLAS